jgi:peptide/nickel transport system substrate-binding protein
MRSTLRVRVTRVLGGGALIAALLLPAGAPAAAADPVVLRVGTVQDLDAMNPYLTALFTGYEVFTLNYDLLVGYGPDEEPAPGFAASWTNDGTTWTFKVDPALKWSDGQPATSEDARWTIQTLLDGQATDGYVGLGYLDPYLTYAGVTAVSAPDPQTLVIETETANTQILTSYIRSCRSTSGRAGTSARTPTRSQSSAPGRTRPSMKPGQYVRMVRNPNYWGPKGYGTRSSPVLRRRRGDDGGLKSGAIDYARNPTADQWDSLQACPTPSIQSSRRRSELLPGARLQHLQQSDRGRWRLDQGAAGPGVPRRGRVRHRQAGARRQGAQRQGPSEPRTSRPRSAAANGTSTAKPAPSISSWPNRSSMPLDTPNDAGKRLDKEGKPINLRMVVPDSASSYADSAQFIQSWWAQLGIDMQRRPMTPTP